MNTSRTCLNCHHENVPHLAAFCPRCGSDEVERLDPPSYMHPPQNKLRVFQSPTARYSVLSCWLTASIAISIKAVVWYLGMQAQCEHLNHLQRLAILWTNLPELLGWSLAVTVIWLLHIPILAWFRD